MMSSSNTAPGSVAPGCLPSVRPGWSNELIERERRLAVFGFVLLGLLLPMVLAWLVDERVLRGVDVWVKPMKFAISIGLLALTTAWFIGHLPRPVRSSRAISRIVWMLIGAGGFELAYISVQAALGQASHYNVGDAFHGVMYTLMGIGAIVLTATQPMLAWQLYRHPDPARPAAMRNAILLGLVLSFVLGASAGGLLSSMQPPSGGPSMPLVGWSLAGGDLRPAHFVGIHAGQLLPLIGFAAVTHAARRAGLIVGIAAVTYCALFAALAGWGLAGRL